MEEIMYSFTVPVGQLKATIDVLNLNETQRKGSGYIDPDGAMFLGPGDAFLVFADGYPLVITTAGEKMMIAHVKRAETIATIIKTFLDQGASAAEIKMCVQFAATEFESPFIEQARQIGLHHVWAINSFREFQARLRTHEDFGDPPKWAFSMVRRDP